MHVIRLDNFEGPLDLLLHLLDQEKLEISEVSVAQVTDQYLDYVRTMEELDLDMVSEFAVLAAKLLEIKAKYLLPNRSEEETPAEEDSDPEAELVQRLMTYRQFKQAAEFLRTRGEEAGRQFPRFPEDLPQVAAELELDGLSLSTLLEAMERVLKSAEEEEAATLYMQRETLTVAESMRKIITSLRRNGGRIFFRQMFPVGSTRLDIVVTFLALLELLRRRRVGARQATLCDDIEIHLLTDSTAQSRGNGDDD